MRYKKIYRTSTIQNYTGVCKNVFKIIQGFVYTYSSFYDLDTNT